jgi:hypothetical protein
MPQPEKVFALNGAVIADEPTEFLSIETQLATIAAVYV